MTVEQCALCWAEHAYDGPCAPVPGQIRLVGKSGSFEAKFRSSCSACGEQISVGDLARYTETDVVVHQDCVDD